MPADPSFPSSGLPDVSPAPAPWHRFTASAPTGLDLPTDVAVYGADIATETTLRLLGPLAGKRVLDLGCGAGHAAVAFARQGAKVIAVDPSADQLDEAREAADRADVRIELARANPADLAFVQGDSVDVVFSAFALAEVADLDRVFRQVHRVLKPEGPLAFSLPHPAFAMFDPTADQPLVVRRGYHDPSPAPWQDANRTVVDHPRTIGEVFTSLTRANFRVDTVLEPAVPEPAHRGANWADLMAVMPATVIFRGRKQGI